MSKYQIRLRSVGNPDHGQYGPISNPQTVEVETLAEASAACRKYIEDWDLGGGNWPNIFVLFNSFNGKKVKVAKVSYNGRLWSPDGKVELAQ